MTLEYAVSTREKIASIKDARADRQALIAARIPVGRIFYRVVENGRGYVGAWWFDPERALDLAAHDPERFTVYREIVQ